jgi:hypothetical protein
MTVVQVEPTIDLGRLRVPDDGEPPDPTPPRSRALPLAAVVTLLLTLGGAVPFGPTLIPVVPSTTLVASSFAVAGDRLYRTTSPVPRADDAVWTLTAHALPDGRELWATPYPVPGGRIYRVVTAGPVIVVVGGALLGRERTTAAFEAAGGRSLWAVDGEVVVSDDRRTGFFTAGSSPGLVAIDLVDGRPLWNAPLGARVAVEPLPGNLLVLGRDGLVEVRDPRTGVVRRSGRPFGDGVSPISSVTVGGATVLWYVGGTGTGLAGLDPTTLAVRWRRAHPVDGGGFAPCAGSVCVSANGGVDGVDPATGRTTWRVPEARYVTELGGSLLALDYVPGGVGPVRTVVAGSGATMADVRGWRTGSAGSGPAVLTRLPTRESGTILAVLGPPAGVLRRMATVPDVVVGCQGGLGSLVCRTPEGELRLWRVEAELAFTRA